MARSRFRRSDDTLPPLRLTRRDDAILADVHRLGACLVGHLQALHFPSYKTAAERCMKLFHHGYLDRHPLAAESGQPAMAHVLGARGWRHLAARSAVEPVTVETDPDALRQLLDHVDVLVAFEVAARRPGVRLSLAARRPIGDPLTIEPDGLLLIDVPARLFRRVLFVDMVRGTPDKDAVARFDAWRAWAARGPRVIEGELDALFAARGVVAAAHRARVSIGLIVDGAPTAWAVAAVNRGCGALIYITTRAALTGDGALGAIWTQARHLASADGDVSRTSVLA